MLTSMLASSYPDSVLSQLSVQYSLSPIQQQQLRDTLLVSEVRSSIESGAFSPENLLIQVPMASAPGIYASVLSPIAAKHVIVDSASLEALKKTASENLMAFKEWDAIKIEIARLNQLPGSKVRERKQCANDLLPRLDAISDMIENNTVLLREHLAISKVLFQYINGLVKPIQESATRYFGNLFGEMGRTISPSGIVFLQKKEGVQLGTIMVVTYKEAGFEEEKKLRYYIKTHQNGSTSQAGTVKLPDPKELFVYKALEYTGYGPKTYFFFNQMSPGGFYIATQDLEYTKTSEKVKSFQLFERKKESYGLGINDPAFDQARKSMVAFDIISRIFGLSDVTTNPGNFGSVAVAGRGEKWKILDFRVPDRSDFYFNPKIVQGFIEGNGLYNYEYANFMKDIFRNSEKEHRRMRMANETVVELHTGKLRESRAGNKMPLNAAIERSFAEIMDYMQRYHQELSIDLETGQSDFSQYYNAVRENFGTLCAGIATLSEGLNEDTSSASAGLKK